MKHATRTQKEPIARHGLPRFFLHYSRSVSIRMLLLCTILLCLAVKSRAQNVNSFDINNTSFYQMAVQPDFCKGSYMHIKIAAFYTSVYDDHIWEMQVKYKKRFEPASSYVLLATLKSTSNGTLNGADTTIYKSNPSGVQSGVRVKNEQGGKTIEISRTSETYWYAWPRTGAVNLDCINLLWLGIPDSLQGTEIDIQLSGTWRYGNNSHADYVNQNIGTKEHYGFVQKPDNAPFGLMATTNQCNKVNLSWTNPVRESCSSTQGSWITEVYRNNTYIGQATGNSTTYTDNTAVAGISYTYKIRGGYLTSYVINVNPRPLVSDFSINAAGNAQAPLSAPTAVAASTTRCDGKIAITWNFANDPQKFHVQRKLTSQPVGSFTTINNNVSGSARVYNDGSVTKGIQYDYRLIAVDNCNNQSPVSGVATGFAPLSPANPTTINVLVNADNSVRINWNDPNSGLNNEAGYILEKYVTGSSGSTTLTNISLDSNTTQFVDNDLFPCLTYRYTVKVASTCALNGSDNDTFRFVKLPPAGLSTAFNSSNNKLKTSKGYYSDRINLSWQTPIAEKLSSFQVYRKRASSSDDSVLVATIDADQAVYTDMSASAGVLYKYTIRGKVACGNEMLYSNASEDIGFRSPSGIVNGSVNYAGGFAVEGARILATSTSAAGGSSLLFDANDYLSVPYKSSLVNTSAFTVEAWVRPTSLSSTMCFITNTTNNNNNGFRLSYIPDGGNSRIEFVVTVDSSGTAKKRIAAMPVHFDSIKVNNYYHLAAVYRGDSLFLYLNGNRVASALNLGNKAMRASTDPFFIGADGAAGFNDNMRGNIDEVRIWKVAKTAAEIKRDFNRFVNPDDSKLSAYWSFDENITGLTSFFDQSNNNQVSNENHGSIGAAAWSTIIPNTSQLNMAGYTDASGNYTIPNVRYTGTGQNFTITPSMSSHSFSPASRVVFVGDNAKVFNGIDFTDNSSFTVTGSVYYAGTACAAKDIFVRIDGNIVISAGEPVVTDANGAFSIQVPIGNHVISLQKEGHTFSQGRFPATGTFNFQAPVSGIQFFDTTLIIVVGRVVGGIREGNKIPALGRSKNNIGIAQFTLTAQSASCVSKNVVTVDSTGEYKVLLPPLVYVVNNLRVPSDLTINFGTQDLLNLSGPLVKQAVSDTVYITGTNAIKQVDTASYQVRRDFIYRSVPSVSVSKADKVTPFTGDALHIIKNDTISLAGDPFGFPIFTSNQTYKAYISVFERYINKDAGAGNYREDQVPVTDGKLVINNNLGQGITEEIVLDKGDTLYTFQALLPNVLADVNNPQYSYTKTFQVIAQTGPYSIEWKPFTGRGDYFRGFVFGSRSDGNAFTTLGPEIVDFVLRDPPGSNSYAYLEKGYSRTDFKNWSVAATGSAQHETILKVGSKFTIGFGFLTETEVKFNTEFQTRVETTITPSGSISKTTSFEERFSTSSSPSNVGSGADLFVGESQNLIYGVARNLMLLPDSLCGIDGVECRGSSVNGRRIGAKSGLFIVPGAAETMFVYDQDHIENSVIPDLIRLRNEVFLNNPQKYVSKLPFSHANYGTNNDDPVWGGLQIPGLPFITDILDSTGPSYTFFRLTAPVSIGMDSIRFYNQQIRLWKEALARNEKVKLEAVLEKNISISAGNSYSSSLTTTKEDNYTTTWEVGVSGTFVAKAGATVAGAGVDVTQSLGLSVNTGLDVGNTETWNTTYGYVLSDNEDGDNFSVDIKKPADDYGPVFRTVAGQTSCPHQGRDVTKYYQPGSVLNEATMARDEPVLNVAPTRLQNVPSDQQAVFNLNLGNASPSGDSRSYTLSVVESSNPNGAILEIDGASPNRSFSIPAGTSINKILTVKRGPVAYNYDNIRLQLKSNCDAFVDTINISVNYLASCSPVSFIKPEDKWVLNNANNDSLPVIIGGYDINYATLQRLRFQYKPVNSSQWINLQNFWKDTAGMNDASLEPISRTDFYTQYNWNLSQLPDGKYDIRAVSNCPLADVVTSTFSGTADRINPHPFGSPAPANGILTASDDISIQFNEPVDQAFLSPLNIDVRGVLNGTAIRNTTSVQFDGSNDYLEIPDGLNLTGGAFTVEFWAKRGSLNTQQALFSQGSSADNQLSIGFSSNNRFCFGVGSALVLSSVAVTDTTQFKHYAVSFDQATNTVLLFIDGALVNTGNTSFTGSYTGHGKSFVGKASIGTASEFKGSMTELRIWNRARALAQVIATMNKTLTGREAGIQGNWRMDEADGTLVKDFVKNRHAVLHNATWKLTPSGSAYAFNGNKAFVSAPSATVAMTDEMDFTIEFWFKGSNGNNVTLFSNGKGDSTEPSGYGKWSIGTNASGQLVVRNHSVNFIATNQDYFDGNWHHFAVVMNRSTSMTAYIDGNQQNSISPAGFGEFGGPKIWIGARGWNNQGLALYDSTDNHFTGSMDEVRIWNTARLQSQIMRDRQNRLSGNEPALLLYVPFEEYSEMMGVPVLTPSLRVLASGNNVLSTSGNGAYSDNTANIRLQRAIQKVNFTYSLNNDKIVITPTTDVAQLEKVTLDITVSGLKDLNGNSMQSPKTWVAYVNKNQVLWQDASLNFEKKAGEQLSFNSAIVNSGGMVKSYTISNLPSWLSVDASNGTTMPNSIRSVKFMVNPNMNTGTYEEDILLTTDFGYSEKLTVKLKVFTPSPVSWTVDVSKYEYNMSIIGQLKIDEVISTNTDNSIAAFVGNECRGVAKLTYYPQYDKYLVFLDVYSDTSTGENISFRIWNADAGKVHTEIDSDVPFASFTVAGSANVPKLFSTSDYVAHTIVINPGWNWLSFNVQLKDSANINKVLQYLRSHNADQLRSQSQFVDYTAGAGWAGALSKLRPEESYRFKSAVSDTLVISGKEINPASRPVAISPGWNWIGFISQKNMTVNEALGSFNPTNGDVLRSQTQFAMYDQHMGWVGSLNAMKPNAGYMYKAAASGTLIYPQQTSFGKKAMVEETGTHLTINAASYSNSMNMIINVDACHEALVAGTYQLAVYAGEELRGVAKSLVNGKQVLFFLTAYSNANGEKLSFKLIHTETGEAININETIRFENMQVEGHLSMPLTLTTQKAVSCTDDNGEVKALAATSSAHVYPTPFSSSFNIDLQLGYSSNVNIVLYSIEGKKVADVAENKHVENNALVSWSNTAALRPGIYFIEITTSKETFRYKLIKE